MQLCRSDALEGESKDWPDRTRRGIRDRNEPERGYRPGQAEHEFGNMMLTAPPRETVMLLCGSLGSTNRTVDPYRWLALVIDPDAGKSDHQES